MLVEFASVVDAVRCAVELQRSMAGANAAVPAERRIDFRIGINLGDIVVEDDDIFGDGVNIAARLEGLAHPGGICLSRAARDQVRDRVDIAFEDIGEQRVKNIPRPVRVFRAVVAGAPAQATALPLPDKPSIAVLPFVSMSGDPDHDYFSDGMVEDIITDLSRIRWLFVISRNSSFTYKGQAVDAKQLGRELGVRYVLEGSVRRAARRVRVNTQLTDASNGAQLWADRYDGQLEDIFAIQDEITGNIVGRIGPELLVAEHSRVSRRPPHGLDAWECVIRALSLSSQQSEEATGEALSLLERALASNPDYAQALGMRAWILVFRAFQGWEEMGQALGEAQALIARALAVDKDELWPHLAQGMVAFARRDGDLAMTTLTRAVALSPSSVNAHGLLGIAHAFGGRSEEAMASIDHAARLSPRDTFLSDFPLYYAFAHFQGANYELGLRYAQDAHRARPRHPYPLLLAAACAGHCGNAELGAALIGELRTIVPVLSTAWVEATSPYILADDRARLVAGLRLAALP
jgi:TolB-like protein